MKKSIISILESKASKFLNICKNQTTLANPKYEYYLIKKDDMENFMERCMLKAGSQNHHAKSLASCLIAADHRGHFSHGLNRLGN